MTKSERCLRILELLQEQEKVEVADLAEKFQTSEMTIRRDLGFLSSQYNIKRVYGGATLVQSGLPVIRDVSFDEERIKNKDKKEIIAKKAASLIQPRQRIFIDAGSTTRAIADYLSDTFNNVVVSNNIKVVEKCLEYEKVSTIMIGGEMIRISGCSSGATAEEQIKQYKLDMAFIGAAAVGADGKLYDGYSPEARLKSFLFDSADKIYLLVDSSKFNTYDLNEFALLEKVTAVITDNMITEEGRQLLKKYHTDIIIAE